MFFPIFSCLANNPDYAAVINKQSEQIKNLTIRLETLENTVFDLKNQLQSQTGQKAGTQPLNVPGANVNPAQNSPAEAVSKISPQQEKTDYDIALATLKEGKLEEAEKLFNKFISDYPGSSLQSNASFWYAETFYRRGKYNDAAVNYLKGYKADPIGAKAADSLLKLAYALASLNKRQEACTMLDKLDKEFKDRPSASIKRASEARSKFGCK